MDRVSDEGDVAPCHEGLGFRGLGFEAGSGVVNQNSFLGRMHLFMVLLRWPIDWKTGNLLAFYFWAHASIYGTSV